MRLLHLLQVGRVHAVLVLELCIGPIDLVIIGLWWHSQDLQRHSRVCSIGGSVDRHMNLTVYGSFEAAAEQLTAPLLRFSASSILSRWVLVDGRDERHREPNGLVFLNWESIV